MSVPSALTVESTTTSTADLRWTNSAVDGTTYNIKRVLAGGTPITIATTAADATSYEDTTPVSAVDYDYQVCAASTANCTSTIGVVIQDCNLPQNEVSGLMLPRVGTAVGSEPKVEEVVPLVDIALQQLEQQLNDRMLNTLPCVICPENNAVVLNCRDCQDFQINVTENINSISMIDCTSGEGNIEFIVPPGDTVNICGFPATFGFEGGECSLSVAGGTGGVSFSAPYQGTARGPSARGGFWGKPLTQKGTGGGGGGGFCTCTSLDGALTISTSCIGEGGMCIGGEGARHYSACGGIPPYTWSVTKGTLTVLSGSQVQVDPPTNSGSGVSGNAYELYVKAGSGADQAFAETHGCGGAITIACSQAGIDNFCPGGFQPTCGGVGQCLQCEGVVPTCTPVTGTIPNAASGTNCSIGPVTFTTSYTCDVRTPQMVTDGCNPCRISMKDAVLTVTDNIGTSVSRTLTT